MRCRCSRADHCAPRIVVTGGPGAGKTAVLEVARRELCEHVRVLPEAASIVFGGGFPRSAQLTARRRAQIAIFHIQDQLEGLEEDESDAALVLCDRGVVDGLAYWPGDENEYWRAVRTSKVEAIARYDAVIHLRVPDARGYDRRNPLRIETLDEARRIDERIEQVWRDHPHRHVVDGTETFVEKVRSALDLIADHVPACCAPAWRAVTLERAEAS